MARSVLLAHGVRSLSRLSSLLPPAAASALGGAVLRWLGPCTAKQRHVRTNLARVVPDADAARLRALSREVWSNFGSVIAEYPHLHRLVRDRVELRFDPGVRELVVPGRPLVICAAHVGNWELIAAQLAELGVPFTVVHSRLADPRIERALDRYRARPGCVFVDKRSSARALVDALRRGGAVGLVADQRVDGGVPVSFFDAPAATVTTPARLALHHSAPMVPVRVERLPGARFRMHFTTPIEPPPGSTDATAAARRMTAEFMLRVEDWIRAAPGQWLCTKRRWEKPGRGAAA